ncbi:MAG: AAC(3) family N-acetyltransferase, partial [Candidatus Diapherotrites archaeon]|nr:AAC(3) family N-acetyltransferase [Candidatus Diapherotrites archaeon]
MKAVLAAKMPDSLKAFFRKAFGTRKRAAVYVKAAKGQKITKQYLVEKLRELGLKKGMVVAVHSSLSRLGFVEAGPETVIAALREAVGETGTIMMPTFTGFTENAKTNAFDVRKTRSRVGAITEAFRKMPGVKRSCHPTHSCAALGPKAGFLLEGQEKAQSLFGKGTPFHRLMESNGFVLCLGIGIEMMSMYHVAEDTMNGFP